MAEKIQQIAGTIEKIIFHNPENDFAVIQIIPDDGVFPVIATGTIPSPVVGQRVELLGRWVEHPKYGTQFAVEDFRAYAPSDDSALIKYLASDLIYGVGKVYARRIVEKFGAETLDIIINHPRRLTEVEGIGEERARRIHKAVKKAFTEQASLQKLAAMLFEYGFGPGTIRRIWRRYGEGAVEVVSKNPYLLAEEVWGIGFSTADKIARKSGISPDDPRRIAAGIVHILQRAADDGHCFLQRGELIPAAANLLEVDQPLVEEILGQSCAVEKLICDGERVYLPKFYNAEVEVARRVAELLAEPPGKEIHFAMAESLFNLACRELGVQYTDEQREAIIGALSGKMLIITGGPGTGKTTIVRAILFGAKQLKWGVELAAPTGRAAKRLSETTGHPARTIHRLLGFNPGIGRFEHNPDDPLDADLVILDEVSMVDLELFLNFLRALKPRTRLVLVGDADQLPSVGPGAVLSDLIRSGKIPVVRLTKILRQDEHGLIVSNAHRILRGQMPIIRNDPRDDFFFSRREDPITAQNLIADLVCERIPRRFGFDPVEDIQVITPMHKGRCGARELNRILRERLNPLAAATDFPFAPGDKVMQTANNYDLGVFNGEIGRVAEIDPESARIVVEYDFGRVVYDRMYWDQLQLAYAVTVHKSQGSEYPAVVMPILTEHYIMLTRNLLYTAVTRAKKLIVLVGTHKALAIAVRNNRQMERYTALAERLADMLSETE